MRVQTIPPHHVTHALLGQHLAVRWMDGWYVGVLQQLIPKRNRVGDKNATIYYIDDRSTHAQRLSVSEYAIHNSASSPSWCLLTLA